MIFWLNLVLTGWAVLQPRLAPAFCLFSSDKLSSYTQITIKDVHQNLFLLKTILKSGTFYCLKQFLMVGLKLN